MPGCFREISMTEWSRWGGSGERRSRGGTGEAWEALKGSLALTLGEMGSQSVEVLSRGMT